MERKDKELESPPRREGVDKLNMTSELFSGDSYRVSLTDGNPLRDVKVMRGRKKTKYGLKEEDGEKSEE